MVIKKVEFDEPDRADLHWPCAGSCDPLETALNSSGDVIFTATAEFMDWKKKGKELPL